VESRQWILTNVAPIRELRDQDLLASGIKTLALSLTKSKR